MSVENMTIGKDSDGNTVITLSPEESAQFSHGVLISKKTVTAKGVQEVGVRNIVTCPNGRTRAFLRGFYRDRTARRRAGPSGPGA